MEVNGIESELLVDSGAAVTVISVGLFEKIPSEHRPQLKTLEDNIKLEAVNNELIPIHGAAVLTLTVGKQSFEWETLVAEIGDDGILGYDFLYCHDCELAARRGLITIDGTPVECELKGTPNNLKKVVLKCDTVVPAYSESIVQGKANIGDFNSSYGIVEPITKEDDDEEDHIVIGKSLVDVRRTDIGIPIRIMNTSSEDFHLFAGTSIGYLSEIDDIEEIDDSENNEKERLCRTYSLCPLHISNVNTEASTHGDPGVELDGAEQQKWSDDLNSLFQRSTKTRTDHESGIVRGLFNKHEGKFARSPDDHGHTRVVQHEIDTGKASAIRQPPRRPPRAFEGEEEAIIERQLKAGIITESTSAWASPLVFVRKRDGTTRACVDYRKLNDVTSFCAYPLPKIADCLDCLHGAKLFSTLDLQAGYWQIEVKPEDRHKTAFVSSRYGHYEYVRMPFGLCNAPSTFERCMELVMKGLQWKTLLIYLDDLIIFSDSFDQHIERLDEVLTRLGEAGLKLKPSKCNLFQEEVVFLGHLITPEGVKPDKSKVEAVHAWPTPKNLTGVRAFLGLCSYYRRFIFQFAHIAHPLNRLLEAGQAFEWTEDCQIAFDTLKSKLTGDEVMAYPNDDGLYILDTDASNTGIGATLSQVQWCEKTNQDEERPIAYASRSMTKTQRKYCTTRRELLAVVTFTQQFRHYLLGRKFRIRTDHSALRWIISFREPVDQMARWIELLSQYDYELSHRAGKKHNNADALSRQNCDPEECQCYDRDTILSDLPCGGCKDCTRKHEMWSEFFEVDDVVPLAMKQLNSSSTIKKCKTKCDNNSRSVPNKNIFLMLFISLLFLTTLVMRSTLSGTYMLWNCLQCSFWTVATCRKTRRSDCINYGHSPLGGSPPEDQRVDSPSGVRNLIVKLIHRVKSRGGDKGKAVHPSATCALEGPGAASEIGWIDGYSMKDIARIQREDPDLRKIIEWMENSNHRPDKDKVELRHESPCTRQMYLLWKQLILKDSVLYKRWETVGNSQSYLQLVVPRTLQNTVMFAMHNAVTAAHLGFKKTHKKIKKRFYWYQQKDSVRDWIRKCDKCGTRKRPHKLPRAPLNNIQVGAPMDKVATDILGPLPLSDNGMRYILVVQDHYTRWIECFAVPDQTAETVAHKIVFEFISRFGCPLAIHSDQGRNYEARLFKEICKLLEIDKVRSSPYHPQGNSQVERFNATLLGMISAYVDKHQRNWDVYLPLLTAAYRSCEHDLTNYSPNMMMLGREVHQPIELLFGEPPKDGAQEEEPCKYVIELKERLLCIYDIVREHLKKYCNRQRKDHDIKLAYNTYRPGDLVYMRDSTKTKGLSPKLQANWKGPCIITRKLSDLLFEVRLNQKGKATILHHDRLKPFYSDNVPKWMFNLQQRQRQPPVISVSTSERSTQVDESQLDRTVKKSTKQTSKCDQFVDNSNVANTDVKLQDITPGKSEDEMQSVLQRKDRKRCKPKRYDAAKGN